MKRLSALLLAAAVFAGAPGFPAARAFAQAASAASGGARAAIPVLGPAAMGTSGLPLPASPGPSLVPTLGPSLLPAVVAPVGTVLPSPSVSAGGLAAGKAPPGAFALTLAAASAPGAALAGAPLAGALASRRAPARHNLERAPPAGLAGRAPASLDSLSSGHAREVRDDHPFELRARQEERFDGAAPASPSGEALETASPGGWSRALGLARAERGRAALPGGGPARLPPAPGAQPEVPAPSAQFRAAGSFRVPLGLSVPTKLFIAAHGLGLAISAAALAVGLGWFALAGSAIVGAGFAWRWTHEAAPPSEPLVLSPEQREQLTGRVERILHGHLAALGLDPSMRPRVAVSNDRGPEAAIALGRGIRPESTILVGEGLLFRPAEHLSGMLAHELGHLALEHDTPASRLRGGGVMSLGLGLYAYAALWSASFRAATWLWDLLHGVAWSIVGGDALTSAAWALAGYAVLYAAMLAGAASFRREEVMADRFAAFVGAGAQWIASLAHSLSVRGELGGGWWRRLHRLHPTYAERLRRLRSYAR